MNLTNQIKSTTSFLGLFLTAFYLKKLSLQEFSRHTSWKMNDTVHAKM